MSKRKSINNTINPNNTKQNPTNNDKMDKEKKNQDETNQNESNYKLLVDYIKDRKAVMILFVIQSMIYVVICSLYQLHNLSKILYAFLISLFILVCYTCFDAFRYLQKRRRINLAGRHPEQAVEALLNGSLQNSFYQGKFDHDSASKKLAELDKAYGGLIEDFSNLLHSLQSETGMRRNEMADYYLMWAHQIKTPIAAMKLLLNGREDGFLLMEELFKIEQYVEMVLHYLRLESIASDMILKEYDLQSLVKQTVRKYSILFINSGLTLKLEEFDVKVLSDEKWLCFVLEQILSNSIKYTREGTISIYMKPGEPKTLVIEDTGIGIRQEDLSRIFERGFTGYNGRLDKKSTGIGLYLCKQIMDQLSHGIKVSSQVGKGTQFMLDLSRDTYVKNAD